MVLPTLDHTVLSAPPRGLAASARQAAAWLACRTTRRCPAEERGEGSRRKPRFRLLPPEMRPRIPRPAGLWQRAIALAARTHRAARHVPAASVSAGSPPAPAGAVPGQSHGSAQDYGAFLRATAGSLFELQTLLTVARDRRLLDPQQYHEIWSATQQLERRLVSLRREPSST